MDPSSNSRKLCKLNIVQHVFLTLKFINDLETLMIPPSYQTKLYRSMYAFGNHVCVQIAHAQSTPMDSGIAATF